MSAQLTEAARWRLLGLLFERPRAGWVEEIHALAAEVATGDPALASAAREAEHAEEGRYLRALGPGGAASPREVAYRPMGDPGKVLAELTGLYEAFAYRPRTEDPADHVAVQAGFVGYLALKEAYALARDDVDGTRAAARARQQFLEEHLGCFAAELSRRLADTGVTHLATAARILAGWCPAPKVDPLRVLRPGASVAADVEDDSTCGAC